MAGWCRCVAASQPRYPFLSSTYHTTPPTQRNDPFQVIHHHPIHIHDSIQFPLVNGPARFPFSSLRLPFSVFFHHFSFRSPIYYFPGVVYHPLVIHVSLSSARPVTSIMPLCPFIIFMQFLPLSLPLDSSRTDDEKIDGMMKC